ncbi:hypothetical protein ACIBI8_07285 [Streptomyces sp. NPDC050529]|uniref:hypothetical protein n=1 Tax=Streptomyces sp. NPDC050529 TaxID=3365624 RepID=UPI0037987437
MLPTLGVFGAKADAMRAREPNVGRDLWLAGWDTMFGNVRAAHEAGVTVLAATDPIADPAVLGHPGRIILRGRVVR